MTLRERVADLIGEVRFTNEYDGITAFVDDKTLADKILALINEECEWTMSPKDLEADKHRLFVGCRPNTIFPLAWDKIFPYCPCCGKRISVKE